MEDGSGSAGGATEALRPRGIGDILSAAFEIYKRNWQALVTMVAIVAIPVSLIQYYIIRELVLTERTILITEAGEVQVTSGFYRSLGASALANLFVLIMTYVLLAAITKAAADDIVGRTPSVGESYRFGFNKFFSVLWISILAGLIVAGGLILLIIPGIIFAVKLTTAIPSLVVENKRGTQAIGRSWNLTKGHFWHVLGAVVVSAILTGVVSAIISGPFSGWFLGGLFSGIAMSITMPFSSLVLVLLYTDLRVRKENLDVPTLRAELERQSA
ncbi:MAG: glycerophosphoryl diester phosphodiesterase membrane domain-containing protein [Actinomycetota bacterium]